MISARDIIDTIQRLWFNAEEYTKDDFYDALISVKDNIAKTDEKLANEIEVVIEEKLLEDNKCPHCKTELISEPVTLNTTEAYGSPTTEEGSKRYCPFCYWVED